MLFRKLKGKLREEGFDQIALAYSLKLSPVSVSYRMTGRVDWRMSEMYQTLDLLNVPKEQLHEYFPEGGIQVKTDSHRLEIA